MKKLIVIIVILLTIFISSVGLSATEEVSSKELTLEAAFKKAYTAAVKWNKKARLIKATSADSIDRRINETGIEGKRRYWNFTFGVPGEEQVALIRIHDEELEIVDNLHGGVEENQLIEYEEVKLSSKEAFKMSVERVNLKPGVIWAKDYHYILQKQDNEVVLSVIGLDEKGYFSRVSFDARSKGLISAEHKIPFGGGIFKDNRQEVIKNHKGVSGIGLSLSPNAINDKKQIAYYYSDPYSANMKQVIMKSVDGGKEWVEIDFPEDLSRVEFSKNYKYDNVIYFITHNKIFKTTDYGCTFNLVFEDNDNPIISSTSINNKLYVLTQSYLQVSSDYGNSWHNYDVLQGSSEVLVNSQGSIFIVANNNVYKQRDKAWDKLNIEADKPISSVIVINDNIKSLHETRILLIIIANLVSTLYPK